MCARLKSKTLGIAVLMPILLITMASCARAEVVCDDRFIEYFGLTDSLIQELRGELHSVHEEISRDGYTIRLTQTLGDEQTLYIAMDVTFPEDVMMGNPSNNQEDIAIWPENVLLVEGEINSDDANERSYEELLHSLKGRKHRVPIQQYSPHIDVENNTVSYILCCDIDDYSVEKSPISLLIHGFVYKEGDDTRDIDTTNYVLSWTPGNKGQIIRASVLDENDAAIGTFSLSRYTLKLELSSSKYASFSEARHSIVIGLNDGSVLEKVGASSGSYSGNIGRLMVRVMSKKLDSIDEVDFIQLGDYTVVLS